MTTKSLFLENDAIHFEYGHAIPDSPPCSVIHGHSGRVHIELFGDISQNDMIIEFKEAKKILNEAVDELDAKFIINQKYVSFSKDRALVEFDGAKGKVLMNLPQSSIVCLSGEATIENIADYLAMLIEKKLPKQIHAFKINVFEGLNKGVCVTHTMENTHE